MGLVYECTTKVCGMRTRSAMAFSTQKGRPAENELRPGFCSDGDVLPDDAVTDTVRTAPDLSGTVRHSESLPVQVQIKQVHLSTWFDLHDVMDTLDGQMNRLHS